MLRTLYGTHRDQTWPVLPGNPDWQLSAVAFCATERTVPPTRSVNESPGDSPELSEILDISEAGMSIQTSSPLQAEHDLSLCLDLSETKTRIWTTGQVVWSDTSGRAGIRFAQLSGQSLDQLKEWLFVNVLTAFDHAGATSPAADRLEQCFQGPCRLRIVWPKMK